MRDAWDAGDYSPFHGWGRYARDCPVGTLVATDGEGRWEVAAEGPELAGPATGQAAWLVGRPRGTGLHLDSDDEVPPAPRWA